MKKCLFLLPLLLAGCQVSSVVSDINDSAVHVQTNAQNPTDPSVMSEARRGCGQYGKSPVYMSHRPIGQYGVVKEVLFACK